MIVPCGRYNSLALIINSVKLYHGLRSSPTSYYIVLTRTKNYITMCVTYADAVFGKGGDDRSSISTQQYF